MLPLFSPPLLSPPQLHSFRELISACTFHPSSLSLPHPLSKVNFKTATFVQLLQERWCCHVSVFWLQENKVSFNLILPFFLVPPSPFSPLWRPLSLLLPLLFLFRWPTNPPIFCHLSPFPLFLLIPYVGIAVETAKNLIGRPTSPSASLFLRKPNLLTFRPNWDQFLGLGAKDAFRCFCM